MGPFAVPVSNSIDGKMLICHVNPSSRSFTPRVKRFISFVSRLGVNRKSSVTFKGPPDLLICLLSGSIAAGSPTQTPCCSAWGWWSESSSSTTTCTRSELSPRPPKSTWALWFWTWSSDFCPPQVQKCSFLSDRVAWAVRAPDVSRVNRLLSYLQMKGCIKVLKEQPSNSVEGLLNALRWVAMPGCRQHASTRISHCVPPPRYTTRHLNDDSTSKQIRALLQWRRRPGSERAKAEERNAWGWSTWLFTTKEENSPAGHEAPVDIRKRKIIIYIVSRPSFCLSFCKVRKEKKKAKKR